jgi:succinate-acetate transporter protein
MQQLYTLDHLSSLLNHKNVMDAISVEYLNYTKSQKLAYRAGKRLSATIKYFKTPQASALGLISFWAAFTVFMFFATLASNTFLAYVAFGLLFLIHTHLTFEAVESLVKEAIMHNILGV